MKKEKAESNSNIALVGEKPLREVNTASESIKLPADQSKPFYHERAALIIRTFPHLYKPVRAIGDK